MTMTTTLDDYLNKFVQVITGDGRDIIGTLIGFDQATNVILANSSERIYSVDKPLNIVSLGLQLIKGSNVAMVALIDEDVHDKIDWEKMIVQPMGVIWEPE
uniref:U6 snRNA-associated Sm-like protein LSm8 n=1 Tax=Parastrongyloides trichosuri TaxID=131310 RepID=A0A0N4ZEF6_PARTI